MTSTGETDTSSLATRAAEAFGGYRHGAIERMDELVDLLTPLLWHTARSQGLSREAAQDVVQTAWLRLVEHADRIADPQAVLGWLITTVRRDAWRQAKSATSRPDGLEPGPEQTADLPDPGDSAVLSAEQRVLWRHFSTLSARCQSLLRVIAFSERPDYSAVAAALKMPVGSIGPTRGRCLTKLRTALLADPCWGDGR